MYQKCESRAKFVCLLKLSIFVCLFVFFVVAIASLDLQVTFIHGKAPALISYLWNWSYSEIFPIGHYYSRSRDLYCITQNFQKTVWGALFAGSRERDKKIVGNAWDKVGCYKNKTG